MNSLLGLKSQFELRQLLNGLLSEMAGENPVSFYNHGRQAKAARMYKEAATVAATDALGALSLHLAERSTEVELRSEKRDKSEILPRRVHSCLMFSASNLKAVLQDTTKEEHEKLIEASGPLALSHALPDTIRQPAYIALGMMVSAQAKKTPLSPQAQNTCLRYTQEAAANFASHIGGYFSE